jgi:hypothetical protein
MDKIVAILEAITDKCMQKDKYQFRSKQERLFVEGRK